MPNILVKVKFSKKNFEDQIWVKTAQKQGQN